MAGAAEHFDDLETRDPAAREAALMRALPRQIAHAKAHAPAYARTLRDVDPDAVTDRAALAAVPVTRKADITAQQAEEPPFGGLAAVAPGAAARLFASPGPIYELETPQPDFWGASRALFAAGFRRGDIAHNSFSYHLTPGGWILDGGLRALGCAVIPGGVGNTEAQVQAIAQFKPAGYAGTPDFLKVLLDKGAELGLNCASIAKGLVSGGALFPSLRKEYAERGVAILQAYATADLGVIAYESRADGGLIVNEGLIVEIVRPGTGDPVPEGEVGEVVVTTLNPDYPLIRFATGDLSAVLAGVSTCGRTNQRLKGWMGRADQTTKVKGMFVHAGQIAQVAKRHPEIARARLVVARAGQADVMTLHCEILAEGARGEALAQAVAATLQDVTKLKGAVELHPAGELANDGKVIEDARSYD
jgi:phenylacetate-coenzyme A ligase PaaK-like adenylate-forming protein